jgi:hypothetical protein
MDGKEPSARAEVLVDAYSDVDMDAIKRRNMAAYSVYSVHD